MSNKLETAQHELQLVVNSIKSKGDINKEVAAKLGYSVDMLNKITAGKRCQNDVKKLNEVIQAYRKHLRTLYK